MSENPTQPQRLLTRHAFDSSPFATVCSLYKIVEWNNGQQLLARACTCSNLQQNKFDGCIKTIVKRKRHSSVFVKCCA